MKRNTSILYASIGLALVIIFGILFGMKMREGMTIPKSDIPDGDEDLYILKSEVIPPVCPKCPDVQVCARCGGKPCRPCPPCGRCPEPAFECKKVPNYDSVNESYLPGPLSDSFSEYSFANEGNIPRPRLNSFSQF